MVKSTKIRVAVLFGGRSCEHEISIQSATNIVRHLDQSRYDILPIGVDKQGSWFSCDMLAPQADKNQLLQITPMPERLLFAPMHEQSITSLPLALQNPFRASRIQPIDVVFPMIHGTLGEDGTLQGFLEQVNLPYVGCGVLSSAIGMDKDITKRLVRAAGLPVSNFMSIKRSNWERDATAVCQRISKHLSLPVFVKPANAGSSVGVQKVKLADELRAAINMAFRYDTKVVVEQAIDAYEFEVAVLEAAEYGAEPIVSPVGEVIPGSHHEFYSYAAKYLDEKGAETVIPARHATAGLQRELQAMAIRLFDILECEGMIRADFLVDKHTGKIYFNEINTLPGFTQISMYPELMQAAGISYSTLLSNLITVALNRYERKYCAITRDNAPLT